MSGQANKRHRFFRVLTWLWLVALTILMLMPGSKVPKIRLDFVIPTDKLLHFTTFAISATLFLLSNPWKNVRTRYWIVIGLMAYAVVIEYAQSIFGKSRAFELSDIAANLSGIMLATLFYTIIGILIKE